MATKSRDSSVKPSSGSTLFFVKDLLGFKVFLFHGHLLQTIIALYARIFLLVDLRGFFSRFRVGVTKKKPSENDQLTGHFHSFF